MLLGLPILEVAIGLVLVYLFTSLICSAINEMIEGFLKNRATDLEKGLRELLQDDPQGKGMVEQLYKHPLLSGLFKGEYHPKRIRFWHYLLPTSLPSYIPAENFARALLDLVLNPPTPAAASTTPTPTTPMTIANLQKAIGGIQDQKIRGALSSFVDTARRDVQTVRKNVEAWFNSSMDRVSGWYKRRTQAILLALGLAVSVVFNVSTINIAYHLWIDAPLRDAVITQAAAQQQPVSSSNETEDKLTANRRALESLGLPIGWSHIEFKEYSVVSEGQSYSRRRWCVLSALGWLLTAVAVSFGAPFWFDLLNKFLVVRSTIKPDKKSLEGK